MFAQYYCKHYTVHKGSRTRPVIHYWCAFRTAVKDKDKFEALVYDTLPSTTAIVHYAIGLEKLSPKEQFFDDAQKAVSL